MPKYETKLNKTKLTKNIKPKKVDKMPEWLTGVPAKHMSFGR